MADVEGDEADDYVSPPGTPLLEDVVFCLLGGHGIRMEVNRAAWAHLREHGLFERPDVGAAKIEAWLREPLELDGRRIHYRFPRQRAERIARALVELGDYQADRLDPLRLRKKLMDLPGIGPKTASWIVRNWAGSDAVAILDVHVLRAGRIMGLFPENLKLPRDYEKLERSFLEFSNALGVRPSLLDAIIWREMRILTR
jgi:thermostable 8-oxoguanine DNA glycosylase